MRVCSIRNTEIRIHPLLLAVAAGACVLGRLYDLLQAFLALSLHEACHGVVAAVFGCRVRAIELQPFGGVARIDETYLEPRGEWCMALAGPAASFVIAGVTAIFCFLSPVTGSRLQSFLVFNLTLALINLLPALPLDGGRALRALLTGRLGFARASRVSAALGVAGALAMLGGTVYCALKKIQNFTLPVMGLFLLLAAIRELKMLPEKRLAALAMNGGALRTGGSMDVHQVAAHGSMGGTEALRLLRAGKYNVIRVVDGRLRLMGELEEGALLLGMARLGSGASVGEILQFDRRERNVVR